MLPFGYLPLSIEPTSFPEFSRTFNWAMCRNTLCEHFGVPYTGSVPKLGGKAAHDNRYRLEPDGSAHGYRHHRTGNRHGEPYQE